MDCCTRPRLEPSRKIYVPCVKIGDLLIHRCTWNVFEVVNDHVGNDIWIRGVSPDVSGKVIAANIFDLDKIFTFSDKQ